MRMSKKGFTLLELVIVIIIVGVLASLAVPRFFKLVERARSVEAIANLQALRGALERCYIMAAVGGGNFSACTGTDQLDEFSNAPNSHFQYKLMSYLINGNNNSYLAYALIAERNTRDVVGADSPVDFLFNFTYPEGTSSNTLHYEHSVVILTRIPDGTTAIQGMGFYEGMKW